MRSRFSALTSAGTVAGQPVPGRASSSPRLFSPMHPLVMAAAMTKGCIGENNLGLLEARPGTGCPATVPALVSAENRDRMVLYRTLVEQNQMPPGDIARVQAAFAKAHRDKASPGTWVQDDAGQWSRK